MLTHLQRQDKVYMSCVAMSTSTPESSMMWLTCADDIFWLKYIRGSPESLTLPSAVHKDVLLKLVLYRPMFTP